MHGYDDVVWLANTLVLTALLGAVALWRWRRRRVAVGLRWVGFALAPMALYLIGLTKLVWNIGYEVTRWVAGLAFHPGVWAGLLLSLIAIALIVVPGRLTRTADPKPSSKRGDDDDTADIQAILKRHGIE